jgi:1-aminocyclopropane-1-carboxylate deaminase/D-cysteine desulfhydrase-like pyridoxal-dependent ACC family enzyme
VATLVALPKVNLILKPTPLHRLDHLSDELGLDLWIKRDDLTGFAFGGNKGRKLEYLIGQAKAIGAEVIVTCGSAQSNFIRQLATGCAMHGIKLAAVVMQLPYEYEPAVGAMNPHGGNLLLDQIVGADIRLMENDVWDVLMRAADELANEYRESGKNVFEIPIGGSTPQGAYAFYEASQELTESFDLVISASSSGSTQTGLTYGFHGTQTHYKGIACDPEPEMVDEFVTLGKKLDEMTGFNRRLSHADFDFDLRFVGPGYGVASEGSLKAIQEVAKKEGIFLDPIYTGKAFHALLELARAGEITGKVCFWHSGGTPALFALPPGTSFEPL